MNGDLHVIPVNDQVAHETDQACACGPTLDTESPYLWVHHSLDGREKEEA